MSESVGYRVADEGEDLRFVVATWASSYKSAHTAGIISSEDWSSIMHIQLNKLIARPGVRTIVAYDPASPDFLFGHICGETRPELGLPVIHYLYVKSPHRREGHARGLCEALGVNIRRPFAFSCRTAIVSHLVSVGKLPRSRFRPEMARAMVGGVRDPDKEQQHE